MTDNRPLFRCVLSVPVEMHVHARDRDVAMALAMSQLRDQTPTVELRDGQRFNLTKLAVEDLDDEPNS